MQQPKFLLEEFCAKGQEGSDFIYPPISSPDNTVSTLDQGFPYLQEIKPSEGGAVVQRQEFNGFFRWLSQILSYMNYGGLFTFNNENILGYPKGALLWCESNKSFQYSLKDNNKANFVTNPTYINDGINWSQVFQGNLNFMPVQQGGGIGQSTNKLYIGWSPENSALKAQVDNTDLGIFPTQNNPGVFVKNNITNTFIVQQNIGNNNDVVLIPGTGLGGNVPGCNTKFGIKLGWDGQHIRAIVNNDTNVNKILANIEDIIPFGRGFYWRQISLAYNVTYTSTSANMTAIQIYAQTYFNNGCFIAIEVNGYQNVARFNVDVGHPGATNNSISALVPPGQTFKLTQNNSFNNSFGYLSAGETPKNFQYIINNITKEVYGYDDTQNDLYDEKMATGEYIECQLPLEFEEWDSELKKWVFNQDKHNLDKIDKIKYELKSLIQKYQEYTIPFKFDKLTPLQQEELILLLNECYNLLQNVTINTIIPIIPDFLEEV